MLMRSEEVHLITTSECRSSSPHPIDLHHSIIALIFFFYALRELVFVAVYY